MVRHVHNARTQQHVVQHVLALLGGKVRAVRDAHRAGAGVDELLQARRERDAVVLEQAGDELVDGLVEAVLLAAVERAVRGPAARPLPLALAGCEVAERGRAEGTRTARGTRAVRTGGLGGLRDGLREGAHDRAGRLVGGHAGRVALHWAGLLRSRGAKGRLNRNRREVLPKQAMFHFHAMIGCP